MNKKIFLLLLVLTFSTTSLFSQSRAELWKKVNDAKSNGLPQTAIDSLIPLYKIAIKENDMTDAVKALCERIVLEGNIQGNKPEEKIVRLEAEIIKADKSIKPLLNIVLARWYWQYYNRNRFRFINRSQTESLTTQDFTTWDLPKLFAHISSLYENVIQNENELKKISIKKLHGFLDFGNQPQNLRPTLFDFFVHEALAFYMADDQSIAKPIRAFEIEANSPALQNLDSFLKWQPKTFDTESSNYKAVLLFQRLLKHAQETKNIDSLLDNDLIRIKWAKIVAGGANKSKMYTDLLREFANKHSNHPYSSTALALLAEELLENNKRQEALKVATEGKTKHPNTYGALLCESIIASILQKKLSAQTESIILPKNSQFKISYQNIDRAYFKLVKRQESELMQLNRYDPDQINYDEYAQIASRKAEYSWDTKLETCENYSSKEILIDFPHLKPGLYYLVASINSDFSSNQNSMSLVPVTVSNLSLLTINRDGLLDVFVLDAHTGRPIENVKIAGYSFVYNRGWSKALEITSDKNGKAPINKDSFLPIQGGRTPTSGVLVIKHNNEILYKNSSFYTSHYSHNYKNKLAHFFTDRAIYRPGQTIFFKAVLTEHDTETNTYSTLPSTQISIIFRDPNHQEITTLNLKSNEFGSVSGSFVAPTDRLTGSYIISAPNFGSSADIRIEEYKRPKFKTEINKPAKAFNLNDKVELTGSVTAYTGTKINDAIIKYRVVRKVYMPSWCWWFLPTQQSQEIAHSSTLTDQNGEFSLHFDALPDNSIDPKNEPTFIYKVYVDATDSTGETRSAQQSVRLGYSALDLSATVRSINYANKEFNLNVKTSTLDSEPISAQGTIIIHSLKQPTAPQRNTYFMDSDLDSRSDNGLNTKTWQIDQEKFSCNFKTNSSGLFNTKVKLAEGAYRALFISHDKNNKEVTALQDFIVLDETADKFSIKLPFFFHSVPGTLQPGNTYKAFWATGYNEGPAFIELSHKSTILRSFWSDKASNKQSIELPITEDMRGGFSVRVFQVKENAFYEHQEFVDIPWNNKKLDLELIKMSSKMEPGQKDKWIIKISGKEAYQQAIELVATMYDASLDAYKAHSFIKSFDLFYRDVTKADYGFANSLRSLYNFYYDLHTPIHLPSRSYPELPYSIQHDFMYYEYATNNLVFSARSLGGESAKISKQFADSARAPESSIDSFEFSASAQESSNDAEFDSSQINLDSITVRENLNETSLFEPHLIMGDDNNVSIEFTIPEALTTWNFFAFAHGNAAQSGSLSASTITQKQLMLQPNPPRFLREGDKINFVAKLTNLSEETQKGELKLSLLDPVTETSLNTKFNLKPESLSFSVNSGESKTFSWLLEVPNMPGLVKYRVVGGSKEYSDGEEGLLPILSKRIFVTESLPLPINGPARKKFAFQKLIDSKKSDTLQHHSLTIETTSNPAWYAVQALPFIMQPIHETSDQIFTKIYANSLASFVSNSDPKIKRVFEVWKAEASQGQKTLVSNLQKNEHLKSVTLQETPWVLDAKSETEQKHNIALLFDTAKIDSSIKQTTAQLNKMQLSNGAFPWLPGGHADIFITTYIMTGFGRLRHLGVKTEIETALKTLQHLDTWIEDLYLKELNKNSPTLTPLIAHYLYGRSFFLNDKPISAGTQKAIDFYLEEARKNWLTIPNRMSQAHLSLAFKRFGDSKTATAIAQSIKERSVFDEEMGRFWREGELSFWWFRAMIETQSLMIEMFSEITNDSQAIEECKIWLLKQKQTQNWKTSKATADAVYALLLRGADLLASDKLVRLSLAGKEIKPEQVEAGTGYFQKIYSANDIKPEMGKIQILKEDKGVAWGAVHWQYLEDIDKVTPHETNLKLQKQYFIKENTDRGPVIKPISSKLQQGDCILARIELRTDRDMEYVHMKDQRPSGFEPVNVISSYKYQDGLFYYEATKDTATHFYFDYLPKGVYVFEYEMRIQHEGTYQSGITEIQCLYAPEFNSHSQSFILNVKTK